MPSVIVDTSSIQYLYQINLLDLFSLLYGQIVIPSAVAAELAQGRALGVSLPDLTAIAWIEIVEIPTAQLIPALPNLGRGEREVISLALGTPNTLAILDDALARAYAKQFNVMFTGTLGILLKAKQVGHINTIAPLLNQLDALGFRQDSTTRQAILNLAGEIF